MQDTRILGRAAIAQMLDRLIAGLARLRDEGRFHEPTILDGVTSGQFLTELKKLLENPVGLMV